MQAGTARDCGPDGVECRRGDMGEELRKGRPSRESECRDEAEMDGRGEGEDSGSEAVDAEKVLMVERRRRGSLRRRSLTLSHATEAKSWSRRLGQARIAGCWREKERWRELDLGSNTIARASMCNRKPPIAGVQRPLSTTASTGTDSLDGPPREQTHFHAELDDLLFDPRDVSKSEHADFEKHNANDSSNRSKYRAASIVTKTISRQLKEEGAYTRRRRGGAV